MEEEKKEVKRPGANWYFLACSLILFAIVVKIISCTAFRIVNPLEEVQKAQNPPTVEVSP